MDNVYRQWPNNAIVYQIYPRSFADANGDGVGDLQGLINKLDYLNDGTDQSLGIDTIWLSPIYPSPMVDMGYDVADYEDIDPVFGTMAVFEKLLAECKKRNIRVLMDYIPNHTSSAHAWFQESRASKTSKKRDWYIWKPPKPDGSVPNNWVSVFGGSVWEYDENTGEYYMHTFDKEQPDLNWRNPEVVEAMLGVLRYWMDKGVSGFRVDAPEWMFEDAQFRDEPPNPNTGVGSLDPYQRLLHKNTFALPETMDMIKRFADTIADYDERYMVTEIWSPYDVLIKLYQAVQQQWFMPFNFGLIMLPWTAQEHKQYIDQYEENVGQMYLPNYVLGNHDKPRVTSRIGPDQARIGAMLTLTLRGIPYIYYGEELGMEDTSIPPDRIQDTFEKTSPGLQLGRDPERTPMQWNTQKSAGFTTGEPWLPVNENFTEMNVTHQEKDKNSMLSLYKQLIHFRKSSPALLHGTYESWDAGSEDVFVYSRNAADETLVIMLNYSDTEQMVSVPFAKGTLVLDTFLQKEKGIDIHPGKTVLAPHEGIIVRV